MLDFSIAVFSQMVWVDFWLKFLNFNDHEFSLANGKKVELIFGFNFTNCVYYGYLNYGGDIWGKYKSNINLYKNCKHIVSRTHNWNI